jgi:aspartate/methionine/tyrosine aminotransferase
LSKRSFQIPEAISVKFNQLVYEKKRAGIDVITLSLGEAFFDFPKFSFDGLDIETGYHYSDSQGLPELRQKIAQYYNSQFDCVLDADENLLISAGSKIIVYMTILITCDPGDEVLMMEPAWLSYEHQVSLASCKPVCIPAASSISSIDQYVSEKSKLLIINNPNNPTGRLYSKNEINAIVDYCRSKAITVMFDEAYSDFAEDGTFNSAANVYPDLEKVIVVNSLSKTMGMSGWRIGYVFAQKSLIKEMLKVNQHLITCAPTILQLFLAEHFEEIQIHTVPQAKSLNEKRSKVLAMLDEAGIPYFDGATTFYIFIDVGKFTNNTDYLAEFLLSEHNIAMVPGSAYGQSTSSCLRISIGVETLDRIQHAIDTLRSLLVVDGLNMPDQ